MLMSVQLMAKNRTPLEIAVSLNYKETALVLLKNGADTNGSIKNGHTLLSEAVRRNYREIAYGANVNAKSADGCTALHVAAELDFVEIAGDLLQHSADLAALNKNGSTPAQLANVLAHKEMLIVFAKYGGSFE